jgi:integrase
MAVLLTHLFSLQYTGQPRAAGLPTRSGPKKAAHVLLTAAQVRALKEQPDTPQGPRDGLLMALLTVEAFGSDETGVLMSFYRPKVDKWQAHRLTDDTKRALNAYLGSDAPESGSLFRGSVKGGVLTVGASGITERNLSGRVCTLGQRIGINGLSAHDCRHSWATRAVAAGTDAFALRDAGGWASLAMPSRYVAAAAVVNERVKLAE